MKFSEVGPPCFQSFHLGLPQLLLLASCLCLTLRISRRTVADLCLHYAEVHDDCHRRLPPKASFFFDTTGAPRPAADAQVGLAAVQ